MRVRVRSRVWQLVFTKDLPTDVDGECDAPWLKHKRIKIRRDLKGQPLLDVLIHELTHACLWDLGEGPVVSLANAISHGLWQKGLRSEQRVNKTTRIKLEQEIVGILWTRGEMAVFDEEVKRDVSITLSRTLSRLNWAFE